TDTNLSPTGADTNLSSTGADTNPSPTILIQTPFPTSANYIIVEDSDSSTNSSLSNNDLDFFDNLDFSTNYILLDNISDLHLDNSLDLHLDNSLDLHLDNSLDLHLDNSLDLHLELQAKIIINVESSTSTPAKWFKFYSNRFDTFHNDLMKHIHKYHNNKIDKNNMEISYKVNGRGHAMALDDE
ncbi:15333_t:CDS:1, partial [Racocetra fulgida]